MKFLINLTFVFLMSYTAFASSYVTNKQTETIAGLGRYYVGADADCDFSSIQSAIDAIDMNAPEEIRIATNKTYTENLVILDINVVMDGGFGSCFDARQGIVTGNKATITGFAGSPTLPLIRVQGGIGDTSQYSVIIRNIRLRQLQPSNNVGGILTLGSGAIIRLTGMRFDAISNSAISVRGSTAGSTDVIIKDSQFTFNSAVNGGAIKCEGSANNSITLENSSLFKNSATTSGGGVYLKHCDFSAFDSSFISNTTNGIGGAIYAEFGADIILERSRFLTNTADLNGGAIYAIDGATTINAEAVEFSRNRSTNGSGGAISVHNRASFTINRTVAECADMDRCNFFDGNQASNLGGAIYNRNSNIDIASTYFEEKRV